MAVEPIALAAAEGPGDGMLQFRDEQSGCTFLAGSPRLHPRLWRQCMDGALRIYRHYGSEEALEYDKVIDGRSTTLFFVALDSDGNAVAGVRAEGPHKHVDTVHALADWAGKPGEAAFRRMVADQIPEGVIETKAGWAARESPHRSALAAGVARAIVHSMTLLGVRYGVGVSPEHALGRYRSSGAKVPWWIPATSYPDDRYRTVPVWWDLRTYRSVASDSQLRRIDSELAELTVNGSLPPGAWLRGDGLAEA
ncbi:hypothetical protein [Nocardia sp. NPDC050406]|uniref:hypothetical protein n=1 Tax=Nocardia sp. NPDC050406 TaxID=3364318 RepID=UPI0037A0D3A0